MPMRAAAAKSGAQQPPNSNSMMHVLQRHWPMLLGATAFALPTMVSVAKMGWSTEQGAHAPIVLATGAWLITRQWPAVWAQWAEGRAAILWLMLIPLLLIYIGSKITGVIEIEGFAMYGALLAALYGICGGKVMRLLWFPLFYLAFIFPPPDTLVSLVTQPLKIAISNWAVDLLYLFRLPVGQSGVTIQIGQYQLLVAEACAGLNSLISLTAICLFYVHIRHNLSWRYALLVMFAIFPVAVFANFVRVCLLILVTYYFGEAAAQGFVHNFAGLIMFAVALITIFGIDQAASRIRNRLA
jgi:exosortase